MLRFVVFACPLALLTLLACRKEAAPRGQQVIYAGVGVSNRLEIGMTLSEASERNDDLHLERIWKPDTWPWEKILQKPRSYRVTVPSLGAHFWLDPAIATPRLTMLTFATATLPATVLRSGAAEISFTSNTVPRAEILRAFGEPLHRITNVANLAKFYNGGESVWVSNGAASPNEQFYFPQHGVFFSVESGVVKEITITRKFGGTNSPATP